MSDTRAAIELVNTLSGSALSPSSSRFNPKLAQPFIYKSVSEETRSVYTRAIREFFAFVGHIHPLAGVAV